MARAVMYWTFGMSAVCLAVLALPTADYVISGMNGPVSFHFELGPIPFIAIMFVLGFFMSLGKAAVYKHIPAYYPDNVGAEGGLVGMFGGLGGFVLPLLFGYLNDLTGIWSSCFVALFVLVMVSLGWMHTVVRRMPARATLAQPA